MNYLSPRLTTAVLCLFACASGAIAQNASISGTVTDPTGAVVPNAKVTAVNVATALTRTTETTGAGSYTIPNLQPGRYNVTVEAPGFAAFRFAEADLTVAQALQLNAQLAPGQVSEMVEVSAAGLAPIELENAQVSNIVTSRRILELPLLTRNPYDLVLLSPGTSQSNSSLGGFAVNGSRERNNNFLLDGLDNNDTSVPGIPGGISSVNPDAAQEFRVITNNFLPEYGRNTGAIIEVITRSGTNEVHGSAYWFGRYNALAARDFFNVKGEPQNPFVRNMFGYSFGAPIKKDKTFFFVNNEWQRFRTATTQTSILPSAGFRSGVFNFEGFNVNLNDPNSPNNPLGLRPDPRIQQVLNLLPLPNGEAVDPLRGIYRFPSSSRQDTANVNFRLDHRFTDTQSFFARYTYNGFRDPNPFYDELFPGFGTIGSSGQSHSVAVNLTSTITPSLVNEFRAGVNRADAPFNCTGVGALDNILGGDAFGAGTDFGIAGIGPNSSIGCAGLGNAIGQSRRTGTWMLADSISMIRGAHNMRAGFEYRRIFENGYNAFGSRTQLDFGYFSNTSKPVVNINPNAPCQANGDNCFGRTVQDLVSAYYGLVATQAQSQFFNAEGQRTATDNRQFRQNELAGYFQDTWKVRPNLTVNLGARYQFFGVPYETNNNLSNLFADPSGPGPFTFTIVGPGTGHQLYQTDWNNIEPRFGFSWDPFGTGRTAIRGGYGIFHDRVFGNLFGNARGNPPFQQDFTDAPNAPLSQVAPPPVQKPSLSVAEDAFIRPVIFQRDIRNPISQNWNFGVQHQLPANLTLDIAYVGSKANRLFRVVDGNPPQPALVQQHINEGIPESALQSTALNFTYVSTNNTALYSPALNQTTANSTYNSLQTRITRRYSHGVEIQAAYTWSHAIDDASDPLAATSGGRTYPRNSLNLRQERGNSGFDVRHRLVVNYIAELPFGRNRRFLHSGVLATALGGWQLSGITTFQTGSPFDIFGNRDNQHTGYSNRVDLVGDPSIPPNVPRTQTGPPISAFALPPFGFNRAPTLARNVFYGPDYFNTDLSLIKDTSFTERVRAQLRIETFNLFNRPQFTTPGNLLQDPGTFGISTSTITRPDGTTSNRQIQLALKLIF